MTSIKLGSEFSTFHGADVCVFVCEEEKRNEEEGGKEEEGTNICLVKSWICVSMWACAEQYAFSLLELSQVFHQFLGWGLHIFL